MGSAGKALEEFAERGFVILRDVLSPEGVNEIRTALQPYLDLGYDGRNDFEGERTQRVYSLVGRGPSFAATAEHPEILSLVDALLTPGYLLTASQAICIHPGETPQPIHFDDEFYMLARPRAPVSLSTIWALDDFHSENGSTEIVEGSHRWSDSDLRDAGIRTIGFSSETQPDIKTTPVEMTAGSVLFFSGTLLHRGGANQSNGTRHAMSHQYCEPWARQQENFTLSVPRERTRTLSPRLRALLGYSVHPPFMGQLAGRHPEKSLRESYRNSLIVDDETIAKRKAN